MREQGLEQKVIRFIKGAGGMCLKLNVWGQVGWPDLLICLPGSVILFIEFKRPDGHGVLSKVQLQIGEKLIAFGFKYAVIEDYKDAVRFIQRAV